MTQLPYVNLGAGKIILPGERPEHHSLVDPAIYDYPLWQNLDRNPHEGIEQVIDLHHYPWNLPSNSYDGALMSHFAEHIPHRPLTSVPVPDVKDFEDWHASEYLIELYEHLHAQHELDTSFQDGWWAFFSELYRVLTDGAIVHILAPYAWSAGAITDPSHHRYLTEHTFLHSMKPDPDSPFHYRTSGIHYEMDEPAKYRITEFFQHQQDDVAELTRTLQTRINVAYEIYVKLRVVK